MTARTARPLPECLHAGCGAPLRRETAERQEGYCSRHLPLHRAAWERVRDRGRLEVLERQAAAIRERQAGRRRR